MTRQTPNSHRQLREEAIKFYGGKCGECDEQDYSRLWVVPAAGHSWASVTKPGETVPTGVYQKYRWLKRNYWPSTFELVCPLHYAPRDNSTARQLQQAAQIRRQTEHQKIVEHYGSKCAWCGHLNPDALEVATKYGYTWSKLLGPHPKHKRERKLIRAGLPEGVQLLCRKRCR